MRRYAIGVMICALPPAVQAGDPEGAAGARPVQEAARSGAPVPGPAPVQALRAPRPAPIHESPLARAIGRARTQGPVERAVVGYTEVLARCQKRQQVIYTVALMRSDAQRDHCFRF